MKIYSNDVFNDLSEFHVDRIVSITIVDDITHENPRNYQVYAAEELDYSNFTREQLLQLPKRKLQNIHDVRILRKLNHDELTVQQQFEVARANRGYKYQLSKREVENIIDKLAVCPAIYRWGTPKNNTFLEEIEGRGARVRDEDVLAIINDLTVDNYSHCTLSAIDRNWNNCLMVFGYKKPYTFKGLRKGDPDVTIEDFDVYIKIDVDSDTGKGYAVLSFHAPEYNLTFPYKSK